MIFELFVNRVATLFFRVASNANCSNNQTIFCLPAGRQVNEFILRAIYIETSDRLFYFISIHRACVVLNLLIAAHLSLSKILINCHSLLSAIRWDHRS